MSGPREEEIFQTAQMRNFLAQADLPQVSHDRHHKRQGSRRYRSHMPACWSPRAERHGQSDLRRIAESPAPIVGHILRTEVSSSDRYDSESRRSACWVLSIGVTRYTGLRCVNASI